MPIFDIAVRPGALLSEGSRHPTPAAAVLDLLDNPAEHGGTHLSYLRTSRRRWRATFWSFRRRLRHDGGGAPVLPARSRGPPLVSHFSTGHLAALAALAVDIIIASSKNGRGTLVRWYVRTAH